MNFRDELGRARVDWSLFNETIPCSTFNDTTLYDGYRMGVRRSQSDLAATPQTPAVPIISQTRSVAHSSRELRDAEGAFNSFKQQRAKRKQTMSTGGDVVASPIELGTFNMASTAFGQRRSESNDE